MSTAGTETMEFRTELKQLLHLITHSLYSNREIFLRELISNASDAINKIRFDSIDREDQLEGNRDWKIKLTADKVNNTLTISDNGIGMTRESVIENLGTIARSGTRAFMDQIRQREATTKPDLIGQFGVGFYSSFMVADRVTVITRMAGSPTDAVRWDSEGQGEFSLEAAEKATRGTDIILHLKEDAKEYLDSWTLRSLVRKFSDFIETPVVMDVEKPVAPDADADDETGDEPKDEGAEGESEAEKAPRTRIEEETLNSRKAIWLLNRNEVKPEEYDSFYESISGDYEKPAKVLHYLAEGNQEFRVLMFVPAKKPFNYDWEEPKGVRLYIQRVLIMEACDGLLPQYLRFVRGVVDSSDLPLNISRELLQNNPMLEKIQKNLVRNVLEGLEGMKNVEEDKYKLFFLEFGQFLKQGVAQDRGNREKIADLLLFQSIGNPSGKYISLGEYVEKMPEAQKEIYYLAGESRETIENSPLLEGFKAKGYDVLLLTESIDEFFTPHLTEFKGKKLRAVDRGDMDDTDKEPHGDTEQFAALFTALKGKLGEVSDIRLSKRLTDSPACLVADGYAMGANYERLMQRMGKEAEASKRVLELNPTNATVIGLRDLYASHPEDPRIESFGRLLMEQAIVAEGSKLKDPAGFARRLGELMQRDLSAKANG